MTIEPFYVDLGRRVAEIRNRKTWSQAKLGAALDPGMTRASIANIEAGKQRVLAKTLLDIADALGVEVTSLLPVRTTPAEPAVNLEAELRRKLPLTRSQVAAVEKAVALVRGAKR